MALMSQRFCPLLLGTFLYSGSTQIRSINPGILLCLRRSNQYHFFNELFHGQSFFPLWLSVLSNYSNFSGRDCSGHRFNLALQTIGPKMLSPPRLWAAVTDIPSQLIHVPGILTGSPSVTLRTLRSSSWTDGQ